MFVVTGFIRSASRMEEQIFGLSCVLHASFAERLKPLTTHGGGREWNVCSDRIYPVSKPHGRAYIRTELGLHASLAERLKPLTTHVEGRKR